MKLDFLIKQTLVVLGVLTSAISLGQSRVLALTPESKDMAIAEHSEAPSDHALEEAASPLSASHPHSLELPEELTDVGEGAIAQLSTPADAMPVEEEAIAPSTEVVAQNEEPNPFQINDPSILFNEASTLSSLEPASTTAADLLQTPSTQEAEPSTASSIRVGQLDENTEDDNFEEPNPYEAPPVEPEEETIEGNDNTFDNTENDDDAADDTADDVDDAVDDTADDVDDAVDDTADDIDDAVDDTADDIDDAVDDIEEEVEELGLEGRDAQFNFVGVGGNIGIGGDTALGDTSFAVLSKFTIAPSVSVRPSVLVEDGATLLVPVTYDFSGFSTDVITLYPFIGAGTAVSFDDDDNEFDLLLTAGVDVPINDNLAVTSSINAGLFDSFDIGALLGIVYTF